jgi:phospholipase C
MRSLRGVVFFLAPFVLPVACSSNNASAPPGPADGGAGADAADAASCGTPPCAQSKIQHVVVLVLENKTFDVVLGRYCTAPTGSNPSCTSGPSCCEAGPDKEPSGSPPVVNTDAQNGQYDPNHLRACEVDEVDNGAMDKFVTSTVCGNPSNFAYVDPTIAQPLWALAGQGAIADRYFQPVLGASSGSDQFFARAQWVFDDDEGPKGAVGFACDVLGQSNPQSYTTTTIADLLTAANVGFTFYAEGYAAAKAADPSCPQPPSDCPYALPVYPCDLAPGDDPFEFYDSTRDKAPFVADMAQLATDLAANTLPPVSFLKPIGYKTDHPGQRTRTSDAVAATTSLVNQVLSSPAGASTLFLVTYDEGGGYFDHVKPPDANPADKQPYGTRVPLFALGPFAKKGAVSHVVMEHSSIVKFIEWNWLGATGQLQGRDANVANLGSLLDPATTGVQVPEN